MFKSLKPPVKVRQFTWSIKVLACTAAVAAGTSFIAGGIASVKRRRAQARLERALPTLEAAAKLYLERHAEDAPAKKV